MKNEFDNAKARISISEYGVERTCEFPGSDLQIDELLTAFYGLLIAGDWPSNMILNAMKTFVQNQEEKLIHKKIENVI